MVQVTSSGVASDPDHLALLSTRAVMNLLDDDGEITVVG